MFMLPFVLVGANIILNQLLRTVKQLINYFYIHFKGEYRA